MQTSTTLSEIDFLESVIPEISTGFKTQTRRTKGLQQINENPDAYTLEGYDGITKFFSFANWGHNPPVGINLSCPFGTSGSILQINESLFIKILRVRPERLHDISESDAIQERAAQTAKLIDFPLIADFSTTDKVKKMLLNQLCFMALWAKLKGSESLMANPWVWVITFEQIEKPENFK